MGQNKAKSEKPNPEIIKEQSSDGPREIVVNGGIRIYFKEVSDVPLGCLIRRDLSISCRHFSMTSVDKILKPESPQIFVANVQEMQENGTLKDKLTASKNEAETALVLKSFTFIPLGKHD